MRVFNRSRTPTSDLAPLAGFVERMFPYTDRVQLSVLVGARTTGAAMETEDGRVYVTVWLGTETYPRTERLCAATPEFTYTSWREAFVVTLAHELRHITQFLDGWRVETEDERFEAEVDAEEMAATILSRYRSSLDTYGQAA